MGQPPYQPPPFNPYNQAPLPPPPAPGWLPPQPQARRANPVGAFFLALVGSFVVTGLYCAVIWLSYQELTPDWGNLLYLVHAVVNGAVVGLLTGLVGRDSGGARVAAAVIAALGAFFAVVDSILLVVLDSAGMHGLESYLRYDRLGPVKAWWGAHGDTEWLAVLGLVLAASAAWLLAYLVGRRRR
ncbi:hypothetical protein ACIRBX_00610 [Kitasatospora sp. NPDC096147]|uniref:hypothetical protein n=1 Tax=Kitasatospora sp. NPDC096147 TaxID=3364093 RepID=UPI00382F5BB4